MKARTFSIMDIGIINPQNAKSTFIAILVLAFAVTKLVLECEESSHNKHYYRSNYIYLLGRASRPKFQHVPIIARVALISDTRLRVLTLNSNLNSMTGVKARIISTIAIILMLVMGQPPRNTLSIFRRMVNTNPANTLRQRYLVLLFVLQCINHTQTGARATSNV